MPERARIVVSGIALATGIALAVLALAPGAAAAAPAYAFEPFPASPEFIHAGSRAADATYAEIMGSGACVLDYDGDGWDDVLLVNGQYADGARQAEEDPRTRLYRNTEGTGFEGVAVGLEVSAYGMGCAAGDYDADGDLDVAISTWGANTLLFRNDAGTFTNVTAAAGVGNYSCGREHCFGASIAFLDYDLDADLDLYVTNYVAWDTLGEPFPQAYEGQCNVLFRNDGAGSFTNVSGAANAMDCGDAHLGLAIGDVNADGWPDIYVASDGDPNALLLNQQDGTFVDAAEASRVADGRGGMGTALGDTNADGRLDITITHFEGEGYPLYHQEDGLVFRDDMVVSGLERTRDFVGWGTDFVDVDADGDHDLVFVNGQVNSTFGNDAPAGYGQEDLVYLNDGDGRFTDTTASAWHTGGLHEVGRGLAFGDFDRDGFLDPVIVNNADEPARFWRSVGGANNFLAFDLAGAGAVNPDALGTVVTVETPSGTITREVIAQASYLSQSTRRLHVGIADALEAAITVAWPDGSEQSFPAVGANAFVSLATGGPLQTTEQLPLVKAPPPATVAPGASLTLTGELVTAGPEGASLSWTVDGVTTAGPSVTFSSDIVGTYELVLRAEAPDGRFDEAVTVVRVGDELPTPVIVGPATADRVTDVAFDASSSFDVDGTITAYRWLIDGTSYTGAQATHRFTNLGPKRVTLTVVDGLGQEASAERDVDVQNLLPTQPGPGVTRGPVGTTFVLDGTQATDPDGTVTFWLVSMDEAERFVWCASSCLLGGATELATPKLTLSGLDEGDYPALITAMDNDGASTSLAVELSIIGHAPTAAFTHPPTTTRGAPTSFDASASHDAEGPLASYRWDFGDGTVVVTETPVVTHVYRTLGDFAVHLTVTDSDGFAAHAARSIAVLNVPPSAAIAPRAVANIAQPVVLDARASSDPDGVVSTWLWTIAGAAAGTGSTLSYAFQETGAHNVTVRVTDNDGASATTTVVVPVTDELDVTVVMDRATFAGDEDASGTATVAFADGTKAAGADVTARFTFRPAPGAALRWQGLDHDHGERHGVTDVHGRWRFAAPPWWSTETALGTTTVHGATGTPVGNGTVDWGQERVHVTATWHGNAGAAWTHYAVHAATSATLAGVASAGAPRVFGRNQH